MIHSRSFRRRLAARIALTVSCLLLLVSVLGYLALRTFLYRRLDGTVLRLAQIEASATADSPDERVHFHDEVFQAGGAGRAVLLTRYAQVWTLTGEPVVRTSNLGSSDLPLPVAVRERVVTSGQPLFFSLNWNGTTFRAVLFPLGLLSPAHAHHLLQVAAPAMETIALLRQVLASLAGLVIIGFAAGGALGWWLSGYAVRPILEIIAEAEAFQAAGTGHHILAEADTDEHRRLVAVLNDMLERLDDALESQRRFVADAGHAIKTPLTILRGDIDVTLRRERSPEEYRKVLGQTLADLRDASGLAENLITLARSDGGGLLATQEIFPLDALLVRVVERFDGAAVRAGVHLGQAPGTPISAHGDPALVERAVGNLIDNAIKYCPAGSTITLRSHREGTWAVVSVTDDGVGLSPEELSRVRHRFFRGGRTRGIGGSGLGLAITEAVAKAHGGRLELDSTVDAGLVVRLWLRAV